MEGLITVMFPFLSCELMQWRCLCCQIFEYCYSESEIQENFAVGIAPKRGSPFAYRCRPIWISHHTFFLIIWPKYFTLQNRLCFWGLASCFLQATFQMMFSMCSKVSFENDGFLQIHQTRFSRLTYPTQSLLNVQI